MFALLLLAAAVILAENGDGAMPDFSSFAAVTSPKMVPTDPGPPPAFNPAEYVPYRGTGDNVIYGSPVVTTSNGESHACTNGNSVFLYPSTPYTIWMLWKFANHAYEKNDSNDPGVVTGAPSELRHFSKDTLVREGDCINGTFRFSNLPAGKYVMYASIYIAASRSHIHTTTENGYGPNGEPGTVFNNEVVGGNTLADGWILLSHTFNLEHTEGTFFAKDWLVCAHVSVGH